MFDVSNQPPPLEPYNVFTSDTALREAVRRESAGWAEEGLATLGATLGKAETVKLASTPTNIRRFCAPSTATATASTRWNSTPPGMN
jgi:hypothetical protein